MLLPESVRATRTGKVTRSGAEKRTCAAPHWGQKGDLSSTGELHCGQACSTDSIIASSGDADTGRVAPNEPKCCKKTIRRIPSFDLESGGCFLLTCDSNYVSTTRGVMKKISSWLVLLTVWWRNRLPSHGMLPSKGT